MTTGSPSSIAIQLIDVELARYTHAREANDQAAAWTALERAHIISQPYLGLHLSIHWAMLGFAFYLRDFGEVAGQLWRLLLAPLGALTGSIPVVNSGRSIVSAFISMPVPDDLAMLITEPKG